VIDWLARDLHRAFPDQKGFSPRNLKYLRAFAESWPDEPFVQGVLAQMLKDPYNFDFLSLSLAAQERNLEQALLRHIREVPAGRRVRVCRQLVPSRGCRPGLLYPSWFTQ
jgi:predicted nuclease of restriction endonuclease-like (RecB) superfamily